MRTASHNVTNPQDIAAGSPSAEGGRPAADEAGETGSADLPSVGGLACYLCSAGDLDIIARHPDFGVPVRRCRNCDLVQTDPIAPEFLAHYYKEGYAQDHGRGYSQSYAGFCEARGRAQAAFIRENLPSRTFRNVLDYGAGPGGALAAFNDGKTHLVGIEPDPQMRAILEHTPGIEVVAEEVLLGGEFDEKFDLIVLSHVLEHLADPATHLLTLHRLLAPDGVLFVETPYEAGATPGLIEHFQMSAGHLFHFSNQTLQAMLETCGAFKVEVVRRCGVSLAELARGETGLSFTNTPVADGVWIRALAAPKPAPPQPRPARIDPHAELRTASALHALSRDHGSLIKLARKAYVILRGQATDGRSTAELAVPVAGPPTPELAELARDAQISLRQLGEQLTQSRTRLDTYRTVVLERRTQLAEAVATCRKLKRRLARKQDEFAAQSATNADLRQRLAQRREAAEAQTTAVARLRQSLAQARQTLEGQRAIQAELRETIARHRERSRALSSANDELRQRLTQRREAFEAQTVRVGRLRRRLSIAQKALTDESLANVSLRTQMTSAAQTAGMMEAQLTRDLQQSEATIVAIRASRAHRLGVWLLAPFAALRAALERFLGAKSKR